MIEKLRLRPNLGQSVRNLVDWVDDLGRNVLEDEFGLYGKIWLGGEDDRPDRPVGSYAMHRQPMVVEAHSVKGEGQ